MTIDQEEFKKIFDAPVYCVSKNGNDETGRVLKEGERVDEAPAFKTIQAAIDKAIEDEAKETRIILTSSETVMYFSYDDNFDDKDGRTCYFEDEDAE